MRVLEIPTKEDDFDAVLVDELEMLRDGEQRLQRLFSKLPSQPHLRDRFLMELSAIQQRAQRLDAVLNPVRAFESAAAFAMPTVSPAA